MASLTPDFAEENIAVMLRRYDFHYFQENRCIEYFIKERSSNFDLNGLEKYLINNTHSRS